MQFVAAHLVNGPSLVSYDATDGQQAELLQKRDAPVVPFQLGDGIPGHRGDQGPGRGLLEAIAGLGLEADAPEDIRKRAEALSIGLVVRLAYPLARMRFAGRPDRRNGGGDLPRAAAFLFIPLADIINSLGLSNTLTSLILTYDADPVLRLAADRLLQDCAAATSVGETGGEALDVFSRVQALVGFKHLRIGTA
jgi:hypothetical protein